LKNEEWKMKIEYYEEGKLEYGDNWIYEEKFEEEILALFILNIYILNVYTT
jgi:hypothetical protein